MACQSWHSDIEQHATFDFCRDIRDKLASGCEGLFAQSGGANQPSQRAAHAAGSGIAIVFMSAHGDIPMTVQAMKHGAVDFLPKPFDAEMLLNSVAQAIGETVRNAQERSERESIQRRFDTLTPRERGVMDLIVAGMLNKQVAGELGTVEKTIKVHRGRVMEKMQVASLAELARLVERMEQYVVSEPKQTLFD